MLSFDWIKRLANCQNFHSACFLRPKDEVLTAFSNMCKYGTMFVPKSGMHPLKQNQNFLWNSLLSFFLYTEWLFFFGLALQLGLNLLSYVLWMTNRNRLVLSNLSAIHTRRFNPEPLSLTGFVENWDGQTGAYKPNRTHEPVALASAVNSVHLPFLPLPCIRPSNMLNYLSNQLKETGRWGGRERERGRQRERETER